jgi:restriction endonuclease Mrr
VRHGREDRGDRRDRSGHRDRDRNGRRDEQAAAPREELATPREERNGRAAEGVVAAPVSAAPVAALRAEVSSAPAPKLDGFAQAAYTVLRERRAPMTLSALSEAIMERRLVRFHTRDAVGTLRAALVNDNHLRAQRRARPLFASYEQGRWGLTDWGLTEANLRREQQITALAEECEQDTLRALGEALVGVSNEALEQLVVQLLDRMGYRNVKVSKRSAEGDVFFTADVRQGFRETRVCVQMTGHREPLAQSAVVELRGTLHHYAASEGVILHLGEVTREAVDESREARLAPIAVLDRAHLAKTLLAHEIGVKRVYAPILLVDTAFVDALKGA